MGRKLARMRGLAGCVLLAAMLAGCGGIEPGRRIDSERVLNAIVADDVDYVHAAIKAGAVSPNQRIPAPGYREGTPLLTIAARSASLNVLRYLVAAGADVNARTPAHETALMLASFFMEDGGFLGVPSYGRHEQAARLLVAAGADLEGAPHGYTALSYAAYQGRDRTVRFLLERGARVDGYVEDGIAYIPTPLMMAAMMGQRTAALRLLRAGANARIRVNGGHTARELAVKHNQTHLAPLLACAERLAPGESFSRRCG